MNKVEEVLDQVCNIAGEQVREDIDSFDISSLPAYYSIIVDIIENWDDLRSSESPALDSATRGKIANLLLEDIRNTRKALNKGWDKMEKDLKKLARS